MILEKIWKDYYFSQINQNKLPAKRGNYGINRYLNHCGAFFYPHRNLVHIYRPWCNVNAVLSRSGLSISTYQYPKIAPSVENTVTSPSFSIHLSMRAERYESQTLPAFNIRSSTQTQTDPFFMGTSPTGAGFSVFTGLITSLVIIPVSSTAANITTVGPARFGVE